ncbi:MAG: cache domain-containing protein [Oscillospiraceae bacterium]|nr:cache domain-containing protein [Oscillospiraceae bacterium]
MSRIGLKLIAVFVAGMVVAIATLSIISVSMASEIIKEIVSDQNVASVKLLEIQIADKIIDFQSFLETMNALDMGVPGTEEDLQAFWDAEQESETEFLAVYNTSGQIFWKTPSYNLADFDYVAAQKGGWMGFVLDSKADVTIQVAMPLDIDGVVVGSIVVGQPMTDEAWLDNIKDAMGCDLALFSGDLRVNTTLMDETGKRLTGTKMSAATAQTVLVNGEGTHAEAPISGAHYYIAYEPMPDINGKIIGAYCAGTDGTETDAMKAKLVIIIIVTAIGITAVAIVILIIVNKKLIITPILEANAVADDMSDGAFHKPHTDFKFGNDELGDFVRKLEHTKSNLNSYIGDINSVLSDMAMGDFTAQPKVAYHGDFLEIQSSFGKIEESLREMIRNIGNSSRDVKNGSEQIAEGSQMLAEGTTQQAAAIQELSASINDIADQVQKSAQNANEASRISTETSDKITYQNNEIQNMLGAMDEIKEKSDQIQNIIKAIDDIAFQTNILALNAAIEAARAGAAGKGFAVVADEVRNLAAKSAESAQQTGDLINATIQAVDKGTVIAQSTAETMKAVTELSDRTNRYITDISTAAEDQAESITQVKIGIERISQVVQQNSATAEETAASCEELSSQSAILEHQIDRFKV